MQGNRAAGEVAADAGPPPVPAAGLFQADGFDRAAVAHTGLARPFGDLFTAAAQPSFVEHRGVGVEAGGQALRRLRIGGIDIACNGTW